MAALTTARKTEVDHAPLRKICGTDPSRKSASGRYSSSECIGAKCETYFGAPDPKHISTGYVERQNPTPASAG